MFIMDGSLLAIAEMIFLQSNAHTSVVVRSLLEMIGCDCFESECFAL